MTGTTYDKLVYLNETKQQIKQAIIDKGQSISENDTFRSYVDKIEAIETGGGEVNNQNKSVTPTSYEQEITYDSGYTGLGTVTVAGDIDLAAENIKAGINIFGVTGNYNGGGATINNQDKVLSSDGQYTADQGYTGLGTVTVTAGSIAATNTQNQIAEELMLVNDGTTVITITVSPQEAHFELSSDTNHITLIPTSSANGVYTFNISADSLKTYTYSAYADGYESDTGTINGGTTTRSVTLNEEGPDTYNVTFRLDGDSPASFNHIDIHDEEGVSTTTYYYNDFENDELTITLDSESTYSWEAYSDDDEVYTVVPDCDEFYLDSDREIILTINTIDDGPTERPEPYEPWIDEEE